MRSRFPSRFGFSLAAALLLGWTSAAAGVTLDVDRESLNRVLGAVAVARVEVPVTERRSLAVELRDLEVTGLEPAAGEGAPGFIRTKVRVLVPEVGLDVAVRPRMSMNVLEVEGVKLLELRFDSMPVMLPLIGALDIAGWLPPLRYPAENAWALAGTSGSVEVVSRLRRVAMGRDSIRFEFDLAVPAR